jgi:hypothetical protein
MNVYDFDGTIYVGDTELSFFELIFEKMGTFPWKFNYKLNEWLAAKRIIRKTKAREREYCFLKRIKNLDELMEEYWKRNEKNVLDWYFKVRRPDDVIASGTPAFILEPYIKKLGLEGRLVATDMDPKTGKVKGRFCVMDEKLEAFKRQFPGEKIENFYSDSWNDRFLAEYAEHSFAIDKDYQQHDWEEYFDQHPEKQIVPYNL